MVPPSVGRVGDDAPQGSVRFGDVAHGEEAYLGPGGPEQPRGRGAENEVAGAVVSEPEGHVTQVPSAEAAAPRPGEAARDDDRAAARDGIVGVPRLPGAPEGAGDQPQGGAELQDEDPEEE